MTQFDRVLGAGSSLVALVLLAACSLETTTDGVSGAGTGGTAPASGGSAGASGATGGISGTGTQTGGTAGSVDSGGNGTGGSATAGSAGAGAGSAGANAGSGPAAGGSAGGGAGAGGIAGDAGSGSSGAGAGGAQGGSAGSGAGAGGAAGSPFGGMGGTGGAPPALDCGPDGWAVENHGPPSNRVNYVILGDGYDATSINTTLVTHINNALDRRFNSESGQPYARYRNFVNICVEKVVSQSNGIGNGATAFDGGNGGDRLARVNESKVTSYLNANVPKSFEIDWKAVVLNQSLWENTGAILMLWSGGNQDGPGAALHEGGHGFHQLADEYCAKGTGASCGADTNGSGTTGTEYSEVNSTGNPMTTGGKWDAWMGFVQKGLNVPDMGATGVQGTFVGSRYVNSGQYRPSSNSMMNSLFGTNVNTSFNCVSREQMIFSIWRAVVPIDSTEPPAGAVTNPDTLRVNVIDPAVINVNWTVDGTTTENAGTTFSTAGLAAGSHMISARAYDNATTDLVRNRSGTCPSSVKGNYCHATSWPRSEQTVTWTVTKN